MPQNWLKMRFRLPDDPKVISMADYIAMQRAFMDWLTDPVHEGCKETAYEHVTRNVTVALCVTGLLRTWGVAYERGRRSGNDLVLDFCTIEQVDQIAGFPCFGEALEHVGWAKESDDASCLVLINYLVDNTCDGERLRASNRERQRRYRARQSDSSECGEPKCNAEHNVTRNVMVTSHNALEQKAESRRDKDTAGCSADVSALLTASCQEGDARQSYRIAFHKLGADKRLAAEIARLATLPGLSEAKAAITEICGAFATLEVHAKSPFIRKVLHDRGWPVSFKGNGES